MLLALPLLIFTLGLFTLVINALLLYLVGILLEPHFKVDSFGAAFLGALIISVVSVALNILTGAGSTRVTFSRRRPPPKSDGDNGPVIDV
jgi:putative membrane protein